MDEAAILKLIDTALGASLKSAFSDFRAHFSEQLSPINDRLAQFEAGTPPAQEAPDDNVPSSNPETAALMQRLAKMEQQEIVRQDELKAYKFGNDLSSAIGKYSPLHGDTVKELLATRYQGKAIEKDGQWYLPSGSKLTEEVDSFFKSDIGLHFTANPAVGGGSVGSKTTPAAQKADASVEDMLADIGF